MLKSAENNKNSVQNIKKYFFWLENTFREIIKLECEDFWKTPINLRLFSLEKNSKNFFSGNDYFVSQSLYNNIPFYSRMSETFCEMILSSTLGNNEKRFFKLSEITELEANIISQFNKNILKKIKDLFISKKEIEKKLANEINFDNFLNLGFIIQDNSNNFETGKFFLSIPEEFLNYPELETREGQIDTTKFKKAKTPVDIYIGKTRLSLDDINNIEEEDIVVLENSNIKKMRIINPTEFDFNVNPDPRLFIKDEDSDNNEMQVEDISVGAKDIWDNVQVDVCAKFPKVKMSLGELREMTEGVVMELDSVYDNQVVLEVENKSVAKGELVIVGYKYGVKITEICQQTNEDNEDNATHQNSSDEDFDVNDFEIEE